MSWLEKIPWWLVVIVAVAMALTPFGESHLVQKWRMLLTGTLRRPLDWFDLVLHTTPLFLLAAKLVLTLRRG